MISMTNMHQGSSSSSSFHPQNYRYDVFLSFRGEDTRSNFTDHLYNALHHKGIGTFIDDNLPRGEEISSELVKAIEESRISIIVFSENYASSRWCLDELVNILRCRKSKGQMVRPVFYKVDPSDVRNQRGTFGEAFAKLECKFKHCMEDWKAALSQAASLSGWPFMDGRESQLVNKIVEELSVQVFNHSYSLDVGPYPVGLEHAVEDIGQLLNIGDNSVSMVGIWGPGGIGKTTIAKAVHNSVAHRFDGRCFLRSVSEKSKTEGLVKLQETLLSSILGEKKVKVTNVDNGVNMMRKRLSHKKVLLILDDVNELEQLYYLARGCDWFGFGSRIIITTRDKHLLTAHQVHSIYEVSMLDDDGALELFSWNAFKTNEPPDDFVELTRCVLDYARGLPLALIVLGSHLFGRSIVQWEAALESYRKIPHKKIQDILKISFDALEDPLKEFFLDVACFYNGDNVYAATQELEAFSDINPAIAIALLQEKALLRIDRDVIWMHDLLGEMGKEIVRQESRDEPGNHSRLWSEDDIEHVLKNNTGTNNIRGICGAWSTLHETSGLNAKSFSEMKRLRYLLLSSDHESPRLDIEYLSNELRWLHWPGCPFQSFPSNFHPKKLVSLRIQKSSINRLWTGYKNLPCLTSMILSDSEFLTEIPDLSGAPNLQLLDLHGCESLVEVHASVGCHDQLVILNLSGCSNLTVFPRKIKLRSLRDLSLDNCKRLENFPEILGNMDSLKILRLGGTDIKEVHSSIKYLIGLKELYLCNSKNLTKVPCSILQLQNLEILDLSGCPRLVRFPAKDNSALDSHGSLVLPNLREFRIGGCNLSDADFLTTLDCLETLTKLEISSSNFFSLPECIGKFINLENLDFAYKKS